MGLGQINRHYLAHHNISYDQAFQACTNLRLSSNILQDCYVRAKDTISTSQKALHAALSCYYSGNFWRGFQSESRGKPSYIHKVVAAANKIATAIPVVPSIETDCEVESVNKENNLMTNKESSSQRIDEISSPVLLPSLKTKQPMIQSQPSTDDKNDPPDLTQHSQKVLVF